MIQKLLNDYINAYWSVSNIDSLYIELINYIYNKYQRTNLEINNIDNLNKIFWLFSTNDILKTIDEINSFRLDHVFINWKYIKDSFYKKNLWIFYTPEDIAVKMIKKLVTNFLKYKSNNIKDIKLLDYCCWTWNFSIIFIKYLIKNFNINLKDIIKNNLFFSDIDKVSLHILKIKIINLWLDNIEDLNNISLFWDYIFENNNKLIISKWINAIISNPPYLSLKINSKSEQNTNLGILIQKEKELLNIKISKIKQFDTYKYSLQWVLNLYKLSLENIINILPKNWVSEIICPSTIFWDITSSKIRSYLFNSWKVENIEYIKEREKTFEKVSQSLVIFDFIKGLQNDKINIFHHTGSFELLFEDIKNIFHEKLEVPYIDKIWWWILNKLSKFKKIKELSEVRNRRWELDQTLHKKFITNNYTKYNFVRWAMLWNSNIDYKNEYVIIDDFISKKSNDYKKYDYKKYRIVSKNIANIDNKKRINYIFCWENDILGNSCNYISIKNNSKEDLEKLRKILNSKLINWFFKIISSNNHLNNYEVDDFPMIKYQDVLNFEEENICKLYWLNNHETKYILNY